MSTILIEDGGGSGRKAKVNVLQQLEIFAVSVTAEHYYNHRKGQAFAAKLRQTAGGVDVCLGYLENQGTKTIIAEGVTVAVDGACELYLELNDVGTRNGGSPITPVNLNTGSGITVSMLVEEGPDLAGGVATLTNGDEVERLIIQAATNSAHYNFPCDVIFRPGGAGTLWCDTAGIEVAFTLFLYIVEQQ